MIYKFALFLLSVFIYFVVSSFIDMIMLTQHKKPQILRLRTILEDFVFFFGGGGSLLDSDLQVVCVWCVSSLFVFIFGLCSLGFSCLPCCKLPPPPPKKNVT